MICHARDLSVSSKEPWWRGEQPIATRLGQQNAMSKPMIHVTEFNGDDSLFFFLNLL
jgi:hypothetical protein